MGKQIFMIVIILLLNVGSVLAGTGPADVSKTIHNLSISAPLSSPYYSLNEDEVCIYCHTPHGGTLDAPLWNRDISGLKGANVYTSYSGAVMKTLGIGTSRAINPESLTCLSCHDGSLAMNDIINNSGTAPDNVMKMALGLGVGNNPVIGASQALPGGTKDLSDDHPISFSYQAVYAADTSKLQPVATVEGKSLSLFGGAAKNVECATCHDPHVDYLSNPAYTPFLAIPNTGSDLCLSCHIK